MSWRVAIGSGRVRYARRGRPGRQELGLRARDQLVELRRRARRSSPSSRGSRSGAPPGGVGVLVEPPRTRGARRPDVVEVALGAGVDDEDLLLHGSGLYWPCFRSSTIRWPRDSCCCVALSSSEPNCAKAASSRYWARSSRSLPGDLAHRLHLGGAAHARDREADVHRGPDAGVEEVGLEVDLAVGDRDDVGRDVGRHVAELRLDDRQRRQRAPAQLVVQLRGALEEPGVEVEDVPGYASRPGGRRSSSESCR